MKKLILVLFLFLVPALSFAAFDVSLKYGSRGDAVSELQDFLTTQGNYTGKVDGKFGFGTLQAVKVFQGANGLNVDGYFGSASRAKANEILNKDLQVSNTAEQIETGVVSTPSSVNGCAPGNKYSTTTGQPCDVTIAPLANLPDGCTALSGYSVTTGKKCNGETTQPVIDQATQEKLSSLQTEIQSLNSTLNTIANNTTPVASTTTTVTNTPISSVPTPDPLVFTERPKFVYRFMGIWPGQDENSGKNVNSYSLASMTWKTNIPSRIISGPVIQNPDPKNSFDWMTESDIPGGGVKDLEMDSCGMHIKGFAIPVGDLFSPPFNVTCKVVAQADDGSRVEINLSVKDDSIIE